MIFREEQSYDCEMQTEHCKRRGWVCDIDHYDDTESEEDCIYRQISLDKIPNLLGWHQEKLNAFIQRCIKCDNLENLYRQGLLGMKLLKRAAQFGQLGASYIVGLLLVCEGGEKGYSSGQVMQCRDKYLNTFRTIWWNNTMIFREKRSYNCEMQTEHCKKRGWACDIDHYNDT
ncbi:hypothetical protein EUGRSUZ_G01391 [Eucalyptus grandis]|uniref:Uncharacterized protein n=2 Tax=Eucalyptus grandis TaxID=71139 RepID=A0ACC3K3K7_EUCGR|nr:hypothetical protein EUGRSUZ_G01391 [Eucalyptus grandis]